jgi:murein L,D-transpeptidase YcbB/YkuD
MWRWMWLDMGDFYVLNNIPEFMQYVYEDGKIIRSAKIVAGQLDKKSTIFSRPLKYVVLRPMWRVPESIMVNELWPSLIRGGGLMRQYGLQLETKDGRRVDWRKYNWATTDIRDFIVVQPPGPTSVLGHVKFSFPSQHTIFMHDTPDKWMFRPAQRTLSHGCLRVQNPMQLAEMILKED